MDDRPNNNRFERQALEALGVDIELSTSTEDALGKLRRRSYDLIISDMGRPPDDRAGYTLLDQLRGSGNYTPYVIYASSRSPEHVKESREHGAIGCTNLPQELIAMVTTALTTTGEALSAAGPARAAARMFIHRVPWIERTHLPLVRSIGKVCPPG